MKRGFNRIALVGAVTLLVSAAFHFISSNNASLSYVYTAEMFDKGATCLDLEHRLARRLANSLWLVRSFMSENNSNLPQGDSPH